jgi:hypothetical protein
MSGIFSVQTKYKEIKQEQATYIAHDCEQIVFIAHKQE